MAYAHLWTTLSRFLAMSKYRLKLSPNMDIRCPRHGTRASKLKTGSSRYHIFPPVNDLTVEDSSVHAESSVMAAQCGNHRGTYSEGNSDIIYTSDEGNQGSNFYLTLQYVKHIYKSMYEV